MLACLRRVSKGVRGRPALCALFVHMQRLAVLAHGIGLVLVEQTAPVLAADAVLPQCPRRKLQRILRCTTCPVGQRAQRIYMTTSCTCPGTNVAGRLPMRDDGMLLEQNPKQALLLPRTSSRASSSLLILHS